MLRHEEGCCRQAKTSRRRENPPGGIVFASLPNCNAPVAGPTRRPARLEPSCFVQADRTTQIHEFGVQQRFAILKQRLLLQRLNETPESETHALIMRQANEAALLAWLSSDPLLTFPCLFEEKAAAAIDQARREARLYWDDLRAETSVRVA
jgi:hypothetical protein